MRLVPVSGNPFVQLQPVQGNPFDESPQPSTFNVNDLVSSARDQYGFLKNNPHVLTVFSGGYKPNGDHSETWPVGEPGDSTNPRPQNFPINTPGVQVFDPNVKPSDWAAEVFSHVDQHGVGFAQKLQKSLTPAQIKTLAKESGDYQQSIKMGMPKSLALRNASMAAVRGYIFGQGWTADDFARLNLTPAQKTVLENAKQYAITGKIRTQFSGTSTISGMPVDAHDRPTELFSGEAAFQPPTPPSVDLKDEAARVATSGALKSLLAYSDVVTAAHRAGMPSVLSLTENDFNFGKAEQQTQAEDAQRKQFYENKLAANQPKTAIGRGAASALGFIGETPLFTVGTPAGKLAEATRIVKAAPKLAKILEGVLSTSGSFGGEAAVRGQSPDQVGQAAFSGAEVGVGFGAGGAVGKLLGHEVAGSQAGLAAAFTAQQAASGQPITTQSLMETAGLMATFGLAHHAVAGTKRVAKNVLISKGAKQKHAQIVEAAQQAGMDKAQAEDMADGVIDLETKPPKQITKAMENIQKTADDHIQLQQQLDEHLAAKEQSVQPEPKLEPVQDAAKQQELDQQLGQQPQSPEAPAPGAEATTTRAESAPAAAPAPEAAQATPATKARAPSNNLIQRIRQLGGINMQQIADVTGEHNPKKAGVVGLFTKKGSSLDKLATELQAEGFPINTDTADGGVDHLTEMLQRAIGGEKVLNHAGQQAEADKLERKRAIEAQHSAAQDVKDFGPDWELKALEGDEAGSGEAYRRWLQQNDALDNIALFTDEDGGMSVGGIKSQLATERDLARIDKEVADHERAQSGKPAAAERGVQAKGNRQGEAPASEGGVSGRGSSRLPPAEDEKLDLTAPTRAEAQLQARQEQVNNKLDGSNAKGAEKGSLFDKTRDIARQQQDMFGGETKKPEQAIQKESTTTPSHDELTVEYNRLADIRYRIKTKEIATKDALKQLGMKRLIDLDRRIAEVKRQVRSNAPIEKPKAEKKLSPLDMVREHFKPGNIVYVKYWNQYDKVIAFHEDKDGWEVDVQRVQKNDAGEWVPIGDVRSHRTFPSRGDKVVEVKRGPSGKKAPADKGVAMYSRGNGSGMEAPAAEETLRQDKQLSKMIDAGKLKVVQSAYDIPTDAKLKSTIDLTHQRINEEGFVALSQNMLSHLKNADIRDRLSDLAHKIDQMGQAWIEYNAPRILRRIPRDVTALTDEEASNIADDWTRVLHSENKGQIQGAYLNGKAYVVADSNTPDTIRGAAWHEITHAAMDKAGGAKAFLGEKRHANLMGELQRIYGEASRASRSISDFFQQAYDRIPRNTRDKDKLDELAGYTVERYVNYPRSVPARIKAWVQDFIAAVKAAIFRRTGKLIGKLEPQDLLAISRAYADFEARKSGAGIPNAGGMRYTEAHEVPAGEEAGSVHPAAGRANGGISDYYGGLRTEKDIRAYVREMRQELDAGHPVFHIPPQVEEYARNHPEVAKTVSDALLSQKAPTFYSQMQRVLDQKLPGSATNEQYIQTIEAMARKGEFKQEELEWSGIREWLKSVGPRKVTKQELMDYLRANEIQVQEVTKGGAGAVSNDLSNWIRENASHEPQTASDWIDQSNRLEGIAHQWQRNGDNQKANHFFDLSEEANRLAENLDTQSGASAGATKFSQYQLPGGSNYHELLLTLPNLKSAKKFDSSLVEIKRDRRSSTQGSTSIYYDGKLIGNYGDDPKLVTEGPDKGQYKQLPDSYWMDVAKRNFESGDQRNAIQPESGNYKSPHFDEPNVLAHVRFNIRTDAEGKKVLFLEEVQSDWHQAGRKKGYRGEQEQRLHDLQRRLDAATNEGEISAIQQQIDDLVAGTTPGVPDAPFKTTWPMLVMKRMLRYAAENGYDKVAWTTGEMQADRYDLSKQVSAIRYEKKGDGKFNIYADKGEGADVELNVISQYNKTASELADIVGKDVAEKIANGEGKDLGNGETMLSGIDLKVGGTGMKAFYDKMLPSMLDKYIKRFGAKVTSSEINTTPGPEDVSTEGSASNIERVPSVEITPKMRDSVMQGQPLFSKKDEQPRTRDIPKEADHPIATFRNAEDLKKHPGYKAAKGGDVKAAASLVKDLVTRENIEEARKRFKKGTVFAAPMAMEASGENMIPSQLAEYYAAATDGEASDAIIQVNKAYHTGAGPMERIMARPVFDGEVKKGADYVIVDDVTTMGSTIAEMADYIQRNGGNVVGSVVLADASRSARLRPSKLQVQTLTRRFGDEISNIFHIEPSALTSSEAGYLIGFRDADALRNRAAKAEGERSARLRSKGVQPHQQADENLTDSNAPAGRDNGNGKLDLRGGERNNREPGLPPERLRDQLERLFVDRFNRVGKFTRLTRAKLGKLAENADPYLQEELFYGKSAEEIESIERKYVEPITEILAKNDIPVADFNRYLYALHAPERNAVIAERNPDMPDGGSGMTNAEAKQVITDVKASGKQQAYEDAAKHVRAMMNHNLALMEKYGLESRDNVRALADQFKHYVPLRGLSEEEKAVMNIGRSIGKGFDIRGKEYKAAMGRTTQARDVLAQAVSVAEATAIRAHKAVVGHALLRLYLNNPDPTVWDLNKVEYKRVLDRHGEMVEATDKQPDIPGMEAEPIKTGGGKVMYRIDPWWRNKPNVVSVKVNGKEFFLTVHDPVMAQQLKRMGLTDMGTFLSFLARFNIYLSAINTSYNPEFVVTNAFRDFQTAVINMTAEQQRGFARKAAARVGKSFWAILKAETKDKYAEPSTDEYSRYFLEYKRAGGKIAFYSHGDLEAVRHRVERMVKRETGSMSGKAMKTAFTAIRYISGANAAVENAIRLSSFIQARKMGIGADQAASIARNLTVNFNRKGEVGPALNALYLFANANIQGAKTMYHAVEAMWKNGTLAYFLGATTALGFTLAQIARQSMGQAADGEDRWDKIGAYEKERNLIFADVFSPGSKKYGKVMLPYGYNIFFNMGYWLNDLYAYETSGGKHGMPPLSIASRAASVILNAFNPLGSTSDIFEEFLPTITRPVYELQTNKDFAGRPIYPEADPYSRAPIPNSQQFFPSMKGTPYQKFTEGLNKLTGGDSRVPGAIDINPEMLQYVANFLGGGAMKTLSRTQKSIVAAFHREPLDPYDIPFYGRVVGSLPRNEATNSYYTNIVHPMQVYQSFLAHKGKDRMQYQKEHAAEIRLALFGRAIDSEIRKLNKAKNQLRDAGGQKAEIAKIDQMITELATKFNAQYHKVYGASR